MASKDRKYYRFVFSSLASIEKEAFVQEAGRIGVRIDDGRFEVAETAGRSSHVLRFFEDEEPRADELLALARRYATRITSGFVRRCS